MNSFFAVLLVACLAVSVYGQLPAQAAGAGATGSRAGMSQALAAAALSRGGGGMNNLLALSMASGNMGKFDLSF